MTGPRACPLSIIKTAQSTYSENYCLVHWALASPTIIYRFIKITSPLNFHTLYFQFSNITVLTSCIFYSIIEDFVSCTKKKNEARLFLCPSFNHKACNQCLQEISQCSIMDRISSSFTILRIKIPFPQVTVVIDLLTSPIHQFRP